MKLTTGLKVRVGQSSHWYLASIVDNRLPLVTVATVEGLHRTVHTNEIIAYENEQARPYVEWLDAKTGEPIPC